MRSPAGLRLANSSKGVPGLRCKQISTSNSVCMNSRAFPLSGCPCHVKSSMNISCRPLRGRFWDASDPSNHKGSLLVAGPSFGRRPLAMLQDRIDGHAHQRGYRYGVHGPTLSREGVPRCAAPPCSIAGLGSRRLFGRANPCYKCFFSEPSYAEGFGLGALARTHPLPGQ